jgi:outer membrane receptor protein involved in Fe transport
VTFLSDVIESDGVRLRGLDPGYTQILINGDKVPGSEADRSFFMDRIPAELIERVEIVRSASARRSGDAVAGTINIVLRDALQLDGGYVRAGFLRFDDGEFKPSLGLVYGGELGPGRVLVGANVQGRYNPKIKNSLRFSDSPENNPNFATDDFVNREDQTDTRDGTDYSLNLTYSGEFADGSEFEVGGVYVKTDREERERSFEYNHPTNINGPVRTTTPGNLLTDNKQDVQIDQTNYNIRLRYEREMLGGETTFKLTQAVFDESQFDIEEEIDFDRSTPRFTGDFALTDIEDTETSFEVEHEIDVNETMEFAFGVFFQDKERDSNIREIRNRFNLTAADRTGYNQFVRTPNEFTQPYATPADALSTVEEQRADVFALVEGETGAISWEAGLRYETTDVTNSGGGDTDYAFLLPSANLKYELTSSDRITAGAARTIRRPRFDFIAPVLLEAELGDNDFLGNPLLQPETAWGLDVGYERRLGRQGIFGVNVFYRDVTDLIEVANTGIEGSEGQGTFVYTPRNTGDGSVYGIEFDLSTPLSVINLDNTGVFFNFSFLDSEITDFAGERRFNDQSEFVYNVGFIQDIPSQGVAFGATYREQGDAFGRVVAEEIGTSYGADLEVFLEKRIGERFTIRAVGSNLLNASKDEFFNKFANDADQASRDFDEFELETEDAGPVFQLMARYAF